MSGPCRRADVLVIGAGPAGSAAAYTLARHGARVVLADRSAFPRDKACGDLVGPRGLRTLHDLGLGEPPGPRLGDMRVIGPSGRRVVLPSFPGLSYPGHAVAVRRAALDEWLRSAAIEAGAEPVTGRAGEPLERGGRLDGFVCGDRPVRADVVIGADGATSHVGTTCALVEPSRVLWAFAARRYVAELDPDRPLALPHIVFWSPRPAAPLPGYGWVFPGTGGEVNLGLGVGTLADRRRGSEVMRRFPDFLAHLRRLGLAPPDAAAPRAGALLGGWLKLGVVGTVPARDNVLLVGDAAGLVNPLQGEGIARALASGKAAAEAVLDDPSSAAASYRRRLGEERRHFEPMAVAVHRALVGHPRGASGVLEALTFPLLGDAVAGSWSLLWNDLLDGAPPSRTRSLASAIARLGARAARGSETARLLDRLAAGVADHDAPALGRRCTAGR